MNRILIALCALFLAGASLAGDLTITRLVSAGDSANPAPAPPDLDSFPAGGTNVITFDWVTLPASNNPDHPSVAYLNANTLTPSGVTGAGAVTYAFRLMKYKISVAEIKALQAANPALSFLPQNVNMANWHVDSPWMTGNQMIRLRFVNWCNRVHGYHDAYRFDSMGYWKMWDAADSWVDNGKTNRFRHKDCFYFLPSKDESTKAFFWDYNNLKYWAYQFGSDSAPTYTTNYGTTAGTVYGGAIGHPEYGPAPVRQAGGLSLNGLGCVLNAWECLESASDGLNDSVDNNEWVLVQGGKWYTGIGSITHLDYERPYEATNNLTKSPLGAITVQADWSNPNNALRLGSKVP